MQQSRHVDRGVALVCPGLCQLNTLACLCGLVIYIYIYIYNVHGLILSKLLDLTVQYSRVRRDGDIRLYFVTADAMQRESKTFIETNSSLEFLSSLA